jgi:ABC-type proline/glycine betaine transport system ATPase subunit
MRASDGAIEVVTMTPETLELKVIGDAEPAGLCGSGLVDAVTGLVRVGLLDSSGRLVAEARLTTLMVTHNMHQAIRWGSRLVMMHAGRVVLDVQGEAKERLHVQDLVTKFYEASGTELTEDRLLLTR